jgi:hypothetical protein
MNDFFGSLAAGPTFFVSAWLLMLFAGITSSGHRGPPVRVPQVHDRDFSGCG